MQSEARWKEGRWLQFTLSVQHHPLSASDGSRAHWRFARSRAWASGWSALTWKVAIFSMSELPGWRREGTAQKGFLRGEWDWSSLALPICTARCSTWPVSHWWESGPAAAQPPAPPSVLQRAIPAPHSGTQHGYRNRTFNVWFLNFFFSIHLSTVSY